MTYQLPQIEWKEPHKSIRILKTNGNVSEIGPTCFAYREIDVIKKEFIETHFSLKTGGKRYIICYPSGITKYGLHLSNEEWCSVAICKSDPML